MGLKVSHARVLKDALAYPGDEQFEASLGRSVRRHGGTYTDYLRLVETVRDHARAQKVSIREAARSLAGQP